MPRFITILSVLAALAATVGPATSRRTSAQEWDPSRYAELDAECGAFLTRAAVSLDEGDARMAAVFLDLGWESCSQKRRLLSAGWAEMSAAERSRALPGITAGELARAELLVAVAECDRAASVLAGAFELGEEVPDELIEMVARVSHAVLRCLPPGGLAEDRRIALGGESTDAWLLGELWGFLFRGEVFPDCPGRFPYPPSYRVRVLEAGRLHSELQADGEWRLAFEREGEVHCASGGAGLWAVDVPAEPGDWNVYVGYAGARPPSDPAYGIAFGLQLEGAPMTGPSHGVARLSAASRIATLRGHSLGAISASDRFGPECSGFVPETPNHRLELAAEAEVLVRLTSAMSNDLVLVVTGTESTVCALPGGDGETELRVELAPGVFDVFIAEPSPWGTGYEVRFELESGELLPPRLGALDLPADGVAHTLAGVLPQSSVAAARPDCGGLYFPVPDVSFELTEPGEWGVMVDSTADTALVVVGPRGTYCSQDWAGQNPGVFRSLEPGSYRVFVGSEGVTTERRFTLQIVRD